MKYKYRLKNKELYDQLCAFFSRERIKEDIEDQVNDKSDFIYMHTVTLVGIRVYFSIPKDQIEKIRAYDPNAWNPYPKIKPPEEGCYLVYVTKNNNICIQVDQYFKREFDDGWITNFKCDVLAFRPINVEPPAPEELDD